MTYAGHALGTWYPTNGQGMAAPAQALARVAREAGVEIRTDSEVERIVFGGPAGSRAEKICPKGSRGAGSSVENADSDAQDDGCVEVDAVVASADYHHVEQRLLPP